jgi:WD40 repeat protein
VNYSNQILSTNEIKYQKLITIHQGPVLGIDIDSENKEIVSCSDDKTIALFSVDRSEQLKPRYCIGHKKAVNKVKLTKDAIWSCSRDLSIRKVTKYLLIYKKYLID